MLVKLRLMLFLFGVVIGIVDNGIGFPMEKNY